MKKFLISDLAEIIKAHPVSPEHATWNFSGVSIDSRTTRVGDCFFAIPGENFDGHDFVVDAFAKGAVCAVVGKDIASDKLAGKMIFKVNDTVKALGDFAREYRQLCGFNVIAITGSVGKTTVRQIVYNVLSRNYRVFQSPKNFNNQIGLPLTLLGADPEHQIVVAELGTNHPGEIAYLTRIAQPNIAVVTNIQPAHLEGFGNLQAITNEKLSIAEGLPEDGILIINADIVPRPAGPPARTITFGKSGDSDFRAQNVTFNGFGSRFTIDSGPCVSPILAFARKHGGQQGTKIYLPLAGPGNVENALAAWAVCSQFGLTIDDFARGLKTLKALPMRAEVLQIGQLMVLNDCYNANPASMKNALDVLARLDPTQKRRCVFICGEMAELGEQSEQLHAELGTMIAKAKVQLLIAVGKLAKITAETAEKTATYNLQVKCFEDTLSACNNLHQFIKDNDIILVKGSRIAKLEMAVEKLKELFS